MQLMKLSLASFNVRQLLPAAINSWPVHSSGRPSSPFPYQYPGTVVKPSSNCHLPVMLEFYNSPELGCFTVLDQFEGDYTIHSRGRVNTTQEEALRGS